MNWEKYFAMSLSKKKLCCFILLIYNYLILKLQKYL